MTIFSESAGNFQKTRHPGKQFAPIYGISSPMSGHTSSLGTVFGGGGGGGGPPPRRQHPFTIWSTIFQSVITLCVYIVSASINQSFCKPVYTSLNFSSIIVNLCSAVHAVLLFEPHSALFCRYGFRAPTGTIALSTPVHLKNNFFSNFL